MEENNENCINENRESQLIISAQHQRHTGFLHRFDFIGRLGKEINSNLYSRGFRGFHI